MAIIQVFFRAWFLLHVEFRGFCLPRLHLCIFWSRTSDPDCVTTLRLVSMALSWLKVLIISFIQFGTSRASGLIAYFVHDSHS